MCVSPRVLKLKKKNTIKIFLFGTVFKATEMKIMKALKREVWDFMLFILNASLKSVYPHMSSQACLHLITRPKNEQIIS